MNNDAILPLIQGYLDEDLTREESDALQRWLGEDDAHIDEFARHVRAHVALLAKAYEEAVAGGAAPVRPRPAVPPAVRSGSRVGRRLWWIAAAACLALVAGSLLVGRRRERIPDHVAGKLAAMSGKVAVVRRGGSVIAVAGMPVLWGDVLRTGSDGTARIEYARDTTSVGLRNNTVTDILRENGAKRIRLDLGTIECDIGAQPEGREMVFVTPLAKTEVKGTRLELSTGHAGDVIEGLPDGIDADTQVTQVKVFEGLVRFTCLADGAAVDVPAGRYAVAGKGIELAALRIGDAVQQESFTAGPVTYVAGTLIFRDDFEEGAVNWEVVRKGPDTDGAYVRASADERAYFSIEETAGSDGAVTKSLRVEIPRDETDSIAIRLKRTIPAPPYALEWEFLPMMLDKAGTSCDFTCPHATHVENLAEPGEPVSRPVRSRVEERTWFLRQMACGPPRIHEGRTMHVVRCYSGGILTAHVLAEFDSGTIIIGPMTGTLMIDNVTIRALVPQDEGGDDDVR